MSSENVAGSGPRPQAIALHPRHRTANAESGPPNRRVTALSIRDCLQDDSKRSRDREGAVDMALTALFVRGCSENADVDSAALVREITASTEPRMSKSGPLRTEQVGHSLTFVALTCELTPASHRLLNPAAPEAPLCWGGERPIFINVGDRCPRHGEMCAERARDSRRPAVRFSVVFNAYTETARARGINGLLLAASGPRTARATEMAAGLLRYGEDQCACQPSRSCCR
jgi:hypothetical protein